MIRKFLFLSTCVVLTCASLQGCGGAEDRRARSLERGQQFLAERDFGKARIEFSNALQIEPNDAQARYFAALAAEEENDLRAAAQGYQAVLNVDATHPLALAALGRLYVFSGLADRAGELLQEGLTAHPGHPELLVVRAAVDLALGKEQEALDGARAVLETVPNHQYAVALLAGMHRNRGEEQQAIELVEGALVAAPDSIDLRTVLAQLYVDIGSTERAEQELRRIVELRPTELPHRQRLVSFYASTGRPDRAEAVLREILDVDPTSVEFKIALVNYIASQRSIEAAEQELLEFLARESGDDALRLAAGQFYEAHNLPDEAERVYREVIDRADMSPSGLSARNRIAAMQIRAGRAGEAEALIATVLDRNPRDNDALVLRATLALASGNINDAITDLRAVLRDQPESSPLLQTLARAHVQNGEVDLARESYRRAIEVDPANTTVLVEFSDHLNRRGANEEARPLLDAALRAEPQNLAALEIQFRVLGALGDTFGAVQAAEAIKTAAPANPLGYYLRGLAHEAARELVPAIASYDAALERAPRAAEPLGALARLLVMAGRIDEARGRLEQVVAALPDHAVALNLLAELVLSQGEVERALDLTEQAIQMDASWWIPYRTKAMALLARGHSDAAKQAYRDGLAATSDSAALGMDLATLHERDNEPERAIEVYERLQRSSPASEPLANNLAMLLTTYRDDAASRERADGLVRGFRNSSNPAYLNTYGWVRYSLGQYGEAVSYLRRASAAQPGNPVMRYHLGMALMATGDAEQARTELERALLSDQPFPGKDAARQALASLTQTPG